MKSAKISENQNWGFAISNFAKIEINVNDQKLQNLLGDSDCVFQTDNLVVKCLSKLLNLFVFKI